MRWVYIFERPKALKEVLRSCSNYKGAELQELSAYRWLSRLTSLYKARLVLGRRSWTLGDKIRRHALNFEVVKFVCHQSLKSVLNGIDPHEPLEPRMHLVRWDEIARVDDENLNGNTSEATGDVERSSP